MAEIKPFNGIQYNKDVINNLSLVIAPPYDVISPQEQDRLYEQSPYNIVRLIKGKGSSQDNSEYNHCTRANQFFQKWLKDGIVVQAEDEAIYASEDEYKLPDGTEKIRRGFLALFKLEDFGSGSIYPHEKTLSGPKEDRFSLMKACSANFSPIFSLYSDPLRSIEKMFEQMVYPVPPEVEVLSQERILHRLWRISDTSLCKRIQDAMAVRNIFIADGHHRYETALNYQKFMREKYGAERDIPQPYDYCLMYFTNTEDAGLSILPYHRVVKNISQDLLDRLEYGLRAWFEVKTIHFDGIAIQESTARKELVKLMAQNGINHPTFGLYTGGQKYYLLVLKPEVNIEDIITGKGSKALKSLDVNILHNLIFDNMLGISSEDFEKKESIMFVPDLVKAIDFVNMKLCQAAFLVNPTRIEQVLDIAMGSEKMPQKSTFFFPKLPSGLVMRRITQKITQKII